MELNQENMQALCVYLQNISTNTNRKEAEEALKQASTQSGFSALLLKILEVNEVPLNIRISGAIYFKTNLISKYWADKVNPALGQQDRKHIKSVLPGLVLKVPPEIQKFLSVSLEIISQHDFPGEWDDLLPTLVSQLSGDPEKVTGVLKSLNVIFKRYRKMMKDNETLSELIYLLPIVQEPLLQLAQMMTETLKNGQLSVDQTVVVLTALKHLAGIFFSLSSVDLPEYFEDHLNEWMAIFNYLLSWKNENEKIVGDENTPGIIHKLHTTLFRSLNLYVQKYEEEFSPFLQPFMQLGWSLLTNLTLAEKYDRLVGSIITFLTSLSTGVCHPLFAQDNVLKTMCQEIVIPNMTLRTSDEEEFEDNPIEYLRRDIEGSDSETRRRSATELVKGLRKHFETDVTNLCSNYVNQMLQNYQQNPQQNWTSKDAAEYLISALTVAGSTLTRGATSVNSLVPINDFYASQIVPDLKSSTVHPILKADALKFLFTFRNQITPENFSKVLPNIIESLKHSSYVIHSYAAICLDRFLTIKEKDTNNLRYSKEFLGPHIESLLGSLFESLKNNGSEHNQYIIKTIMRVAGVAEEKILLFSQVFIQKVLEILSELCRDNSSQYPYFNHYIFEIIAILIRTFGKHNSTAFGELQKVLNDPFEKILQLDIQDFHPYVFQLLALQLEVAPASNLDQFMNMLQFFLNETLWQRSGNIPPLTRVLQAYIHRAGTQLVQTDKIKNILGIFQTLVKSKYHDHEAFFLLESIVIYLTPEQFGPHMKSIFIDIFDRLQQNKTPKCVRCFLVFLCVFISKHNGETVLQVIDSVQPKLFLNLIEKFFPNITRIEGKIEKKMVLVALTKLLTGIMLVPPYNTAWATIICLAIDCIQGSPTLTGRKNNNNNFPVLENNNEDEFTTVEEEISGGANYSRLSNAVKIDADPVPEVSSGPAFFAKAINQLSQQNPEIQQIIGSLDTKYRDNLATILQTRD